MAPAHKLLQVGDTIAGRYKLVGVVGQGGMGIVYRALDHQREQPCAIKVLFPHQSQNREVAARFEREARIAARLHGLNSVRILDVGILPDNLSYIVMELLEGKDLAAELEQRQRVSVVVAVDVTVQAAHAMSEAHALGIVHRDLKPANLFLCTVPDSERPLVKVLDFGVSRLLRDEEDRLTTDWAQLGTAVYMSPEQIESAARVDERTDVWALGVVLYEMLVGRPPFDGAGTAVLVAIATRAIPPPSTFRDDLPSELEEIIMRALEKAPEARFQSMNDFARALAPWAPDEPISSVAPARSRRSRVGLVLLGVAAAFAAGGIALVVDAWAKLPLAEPAEPHAGSASADLGDPRAVPAAFASRPFPGAPSARRALPAHGSQTPHGSSHPQRTGPLPNAASTRRP
jgi:eukaryotic-like serine/threonine-protein kinase